MSEKNYPKGIYTGINEGASIEKIEQGREYAYEIGLHQGSSDTYQVEGYSNLTQAIRDGKNIDWEKLDNVPAKCQHVSIGTLRNLLRRDDSCPIDSAEGWYHLVRDGGISAWNNAIADAWLGANGWSLWVAGEIPLVENRANSLPNMTHFKGEYGGEIRECIIYKSYMDTSVRVVGMRVSVHESTGSVISHSPVEWPATQVKVLEIFSQKENS